MSHGLIYNIEIELSYHMRYVHVTVTFRTDWSVWSSFGKCNESDITTLISKMLELVTVTSVLPQETSL